VTSQELRHVGEALHRAGRDLAASREREQAAEASRRDLVAWVSHDLRTPLAGIRAMAEALEDGVVDDPGDYLKRLQVEAGRLSSMVDTLFLLSRLHAGALRLVREPLPVGDLVSDAVASIQPTASVRDVAIIGGADPEAVAAVDAGQLSRALSNLLVNAVRHTPPSGTVQVSAGCVGEQVVLAVQDQCGGIPEQELHRVFDVAWRGAGQRSHGPDGGGGLGLAITRGIVEAHAGTVEVRNTGTGCRFEIRMPRHTQA
jgi:signal transduction histidine kinase